jgi:transcriptional regulator with XRE-family HTH domain
MESFGKVLKRARKSKQATLRELGDKVGLSVGYISDIEHDRKRPPDLNTVGLIEDFLGIKDNSLINLAHKIRNYIKPSLTQRIKMNPELSHVLLRADDLPDNKKDRTMKQFIEILNNVEKEEM